MKEVKKRLNAKVERHLAKSHALSHEVFASGIAISASIENIPEFPPPSSSSLFRFAFLLQFFF